MKKNKMMRLASLMLVLVLMTSCVISGTFAKYVTAGSGNDSARVAKWGVEITANGTTFAKEYDTDDSAVKSTIAKSVVNITDDKNLVAPGTDGNMVSMALSGTPEVAVRVSYVGVFDVSDKWVDASGNYYCPLVIKVNGTAFDGRAYSSADDFEISVNNAINAYSKDYPANTDLSGHGADSLAITWEWPFSTSDENDVKDTFLGNKAAEGNAATVSLTVTTTVTQID